MENDNLNFITKQEITMLSPNVKEQLNEYRWRRAFHMFECLRDDRDHGTKGTNPPIIPYIKSAKRTIVYYGNEFNGSYNHHNQIAKFKDKYYYAWSNGFSNEEDAGQRVLISNSCDCRIWSEPNVVIDVEQGSQWAHNCVAMYKTEAKLYILVMSEETVHDETVTGMRRIKPEEAYIDAYSSTDGVNFFKEFSYGTAIKWIFEAPRLTKEGRLMCICCTKTNGPAVLLWNDDNICSQPQFIKIPEPKNASFPYGESTWYQLDSGRIIVFWRDEGASCRAYVNYSDDGGQTFSTPVISDIPDSMSRLYAGRLTDGRYFLVNNAISTLLDRTPLMLLLSDNGTLFNKVYMIDDSPCEMRRKGLLKSNGHQYPCCICEDGKLIVAYDTNKEDIICELIPINEL